MDFRVVFFFLLWCGVLQFARLRSIDQVIEDVEIDFEKNFTGPLSRFPSKVWYDYEVKGRTEELVKLQLDMILTRELWDVIIDTDDALPSRGKRNAIKNPTRLWPLRIPYIINEEFDCDDRYKLVMAMDHWEEHTCLKFVEANTTKDFDIIEFVPVDFGCESLLGRMQGRQPINLAKPCMYKEVIVHEIGHALGLYHEHMRHDRNNYVEIHYQNINETYHPQFDKLKANQYNGYSKPYDYESVMHYGKLFYSMNRSAELLTIVPKDEAYLDVIGEAPALSFYDVKIVNEMYKCSDGCIIRTCPGDGFLGKNCQCYCKGEDAYEIVLCEPADKCGKPNISLAEYNVYTNNFENEVQSWDIETYSEGTQFIVEHINETCGYWTSTFNCTNGQWEGEVASCEKACIVEDFGDDYSVAYNGVELRPGHDILSRDRIDVGCSNMTKGVDFQEEYVKCSDGKWDRHISDIVCIKACIVEDFGDDYSVAYNGQQLRPGQDISSRDKIAVVCSNRKKDVDFQEEYLECSDGKWDRHISDIVCIKEHPSCLMVLNAKITGTFDDGFEISCIEGYDMELQGEAVDKFTCSWEGEWKPFAPKCKPASCLIPAEENAVGSLFHPNGNEIVRGSEVHHGSDVILICPKGHVPEEIEFSCTYGKLDVGMVPRCILVTCPKPTVIGALLMPRKEEYQYGDAVTVIRCVNMLHELVGSRELNCLKDSTWSHTAICVPSSCLIPVQENAVGSLHQNGKEIVRGSVVNNGSDVKLVCPKGHVPDELEFSCTNGKLDVGTVPRCILVTCPKPTVVGALLKPKKEEYHYGDAVSVSRCLNRLHVIEGSRKLNCLKDSTWSDTAICQPFCSDEVTFEDIQNKKFKDNVWRRQFGLSSMRACEQKCLRYNRFLCRSFVYGRERGRPRCYLYRETPEDELVQNKRFWTIGVRKCN